MSLGTIFHYLDAPLARQDKNVVHFTRPSSKVHCNDSLGSWRQYVANAFSRNVLALAVHVGEDWTGTEHNRTTRRGNKRPAGGNDFISWADTQCLQGAFQRHGSVRQRNRIFATRKCRKLRLEKPAFLRSSN